MIAINAYIFFIISRNQVLTDLFQVKTYSHDLTQLSKLLSMVRSLIDNPSLFLEPYVSKIIMPNKLMFLLISLLLSNCRSQPRSINGYQQIVGKLKECWGVQ